MRILAATGVIVLVASCDPPVRVEASPAATYRDTIITTSEWVNGLLVEHHVLFDTAGQVSLRSEHISMFDTIMSALDQDMHHGGHAFRFGPYELWTRAISEDTFKVMVDSVRAGRFLCFRDNVVVPDAMVIERRTEGYGSYRNAGTLVARGTMDTVLLWYVVDRDLPKLAVWNWEEVTPMTYDEYAQLRKELKEVSDHLATPSEVDPMLRSNK